MRSGFRFDQKEKNLQEVSVIFLRIDHFHSFRPSHQNGGRGSHTPSSSGPGKHTPNTPDTGPDCQSGDPVFRLHRKLCPRPRKKWHFGSILQNRVKRGPLKPAIQRACTGPCFPEVPEEEAGAKKAVMQRSSPEKMILISAFLGLYGYRMGKIRGQN